VSRRTLAKLNSPAFGSRRAAGIVDGLLLPKGEYDMLNWALMFFLVALLAAVFGFTGVAVAAAGIAKLLFFLFLVLFVASLVIGLANRARP
jgi:uncharacterized membrane protein YtjA (UPF0391 family)